MSSPEIVQSLASLSTATLGEVQAAIVNAPLRPLTRPCHLCGPAYPVCIPSHDNLGVHYALAKAPPGSVLVVQCKDGPTHGFWGEIAAIAAQSRGIAGLVTDGPVRDSDAMIALGFPVFSAGLEIRGTIKKETVSVGAPIVLGGVTIRAGDYIVADSDGIVVITPETAEAVIQAAINRDKKEQDIMEKLRQGKTTIDLLSLPKETE